MKKLFLSLFCFALLTSVQAQKLSKEEAEKATSELLAEREAKIKAEYGHEWKEGELTNGDYKMKFIYRVVGEKPADGRALYISMHGGGGAPAEVNDQQWENQKKLYTPQEGLYFVPRSPTDTWNMWHQFYMDGFVDKIIQLAGIYEDVNPNKVYVMGYSAGGDGTFQLAPRLADHWAAASMMAGHPNNAKIENLRNLPFSIFMGGKDAAYNRNGLAREWIARLDSLHNAEGGFISDSHIYEECGHWMNRQDSVAMSWMPKFTRNPYPNKVSWVQDDVIRDSFYWLYASPNGRNEDCKVVAEYDGENNTVNIIYADSPSVIFGLNDNMMDLDKPVTIQYQGETIYKKVLPRSLKSIKADVDAGRDPYLIFPVKVKVMHGKQVTVL